jgi:hypothetical protein
MRSRLHHDPSVVAQDAGEAGVAEDLDAVLGAGRG